jgi:competence protein ComEA
VRRDALLTLLGIFACLVLTAFSVVPHLKFNKAEIVQEMSPIVIAISGEVNKPGTYELPWGSRLEDAIDSAGGLKIDADKNLVNLARPLDAGEAIFVPAKQTETGVERISINGSSLSQLDSLPRIGPAMAQRITEARPFNTIDDLLNVKGIGAKTLEKLKPFITL